MLTPKQFPTASTKIPGITPSKNLKPAAVPPVPHPAMPSPHAAKPPNIHTLYYASRRANRTTNPVRVSTRHFQRPFVRNKWSIPSSAQPVKPPGVPHLPSKYNW